VSLRNVGSIFRVSGLFFGVLIPPICFALDPFFFAGASQEFGNWHELGLAESHSTLAFTAYWLLLISVIGMLHHCVVPDWRKPRLEQPALVIGILFSAFFSFAILPVTPIAGALFFLVLPLLVFAPMCSLAVYVGAYRHSMRDADAASHARVWVVALSFLCVSFLPHLHYNNSVAGLELAQRPSELVPALERVARFRGLARADLRRIYRNSDPLKRLRIRNLYYEMTQQDLLDQAADNPL